MSVSFNAATAFPVGRNSNSAVTVDVNGDGNSDIITGGFAFQGSTATGGLSTLLGNGAGSFGPAIISSGQQFGSANSLATGDFNNDGKLDAITTGSLLGGSASDVFVALGDGTGSFKSSANVVVGSNPQSVAVGDVNGDGLLDAVTANSGGNTVSILIGDGKGGFKSTSNLTLEGNPGAVALRDLNGDGRLDLAAITIVNASLPNGTSSRVGKLSLLVGDGKGAFTPSTSIDLGEVKFGGSDLTFANFNGDSRVEIAAIAGGTITILSADPIQQYRPVFQTDQLISADSIQTGDFNQDGRIDLAVSTTSLGSSGNGTNVLLGDGTGRFSRPVAFPPTSGFDGSVAAADFNKDGKPDLAVANSSFTDATVLLNNTTETDAIAQGTVEVSSSTGLDKVGYLDASSTSNGSATVDLGKGTFVLNGATRITRSTQGVDQIIGTVQNDKIKGNGNKNLLDGYVGNDQLTGGNGDDTLVGGEGKDELEGGKGKDNFVFSATPNYPEGLETAFSKALVGVDRILDFERGKDKMLLDAGTFTALKAGQKAKFNIVDDAAEARLAKGSIAYVRDTGNLYYNANGAKSGFGGGGKFAEVEDGLRLAAKDFSVFL